MSKSSSLTSSTPSSTKRIVSTGAAIGLVIAMGAIGVAVYPDSAHGAPASANVATEQPAVVQTFASGEALLTLTGPDGLDSSFGLVLDGVVQNVDFPVKGGATKRIILRDLMPQMAVTINPPIDGTPVTAFTPPPASIFVASTENRVKPTKVKTVVKMRNRSNSQTVTFVVTAMDRTGSHQWSYELPPLTKLVKHQFSGLTKGSIIYTTVSNGSTIDGLDVCKVKASGICR